MTKRKQPNNNHDSNKKRKTRTPIKKEEIILHQGFVDYYKKQ